MIDIDKKVTYGEIFANLRKVFSWLEDDISRNLFLMRMNGNIIREKPMLNHIKPYLSKKLQGDLDKYPNSVYNIDFNINETVVLYGGGVSGRDLVNDRNINLKDKVNKIVLCDQNINSIDKWWTEDIHTIAPNELFEKYRDCKIVVTSYMCYEEIYNSLIQNNIPNENISFYIFVDNDAQYFDDIIDFGDNEIFVDGGVFDGTNSLNFAKKCPNYKHIYMFEPGKEHYENILEKIDNTIERATVYNLGLWNEEKTITFSNNGQGSRISDVGTETIQVNSIDNVLGNEKVTFIKMDIEGAELNALKGASEIIKKNKPKLAICIYHKPEDIVEILGYIKSLVPEYKLYIRQYTNIYLETVLYAVL